MFVEKTEYCGGLKLCTSNDNTNLRPGNSIWDSKIDQTDQVSPLQNTCNESYGLLIEFSDNCKVKAS